MASDQESKASRYDFIIIPLNIVWLFVLGNALFNWLLAGAVERFTSMYGQDIAQARKAEEMIGIHYGWLIPAVLLAVFLRIAYKNDLLIYLVGCTLMMSIFTVIGFMVL